MRWLPEDTETLVVARSFTVPDPDKVPDWLDYGLGMACQGLVLDCQNQFKGFDLELIPAVKDAGAVPTGRKGLIIIAAVGNQLHFRVFDWDGRLLVNTNEGRLPELARQIDELRRQLAGLWPPHRIKEAEKPSAIWAVTSIVAQAQFKPLRGRKIECVVHGARNFESVSKFGSLRSEGCTIVVFEADLGDAAREWTESLRQGAESVRTLVGREVFVYPSATVTDHWARKTRWQGAYYVLLKPNTLLCASSDRYLETVLRRVDEAPVGRALPDNLPEWSHVDLDAPAWMLRHVPNAGEKARTVGLTAAFTSRGFRVVYLPRNGSHVDIKQVENRWSFGDVVVSRDPLDPFHVARTARRHGRPDSRHTTGRELALVRLADLWAAGVRALRGREMNAGGRLAPR